MKINKFLCFIVVLILCPLFVYSGDTVTVQTFTFDSIFTRQAVFKFPDANEKFQRVIAKYRLKCDPKTEHDKYSCAEWDYLAYMKIHKPTGEDAFSIYKHPVSTLGNFNKPVPGTKFSFKDEANIDTVNISNVKSTSVSDNITKFALGTGEVELKDFSRHQFLLFNKELVEQGIKEGTKIGKISFDASIVDTMEHVRIRIAPVKKLTQQILAYNENLEYQDVVYQTFVTKEDCQDGKTLTLDFEKDFVYDGSSNLIVDVSYIPTKGSKNVFRGTTSSKNVAITIANSNYIRLNGDDAWINTTNLPSISGGQHFTFEGWVRLRDAGVIFRLGDKVVISANTPNADNAMSMSIGLKGEHSLNAFTNNSPIHLNEWTHIAVVYNGNGETCKDVLKLFINSKPAALEYHQYWVTIYMPRFIDDLPVDFAIGQGEYLSDTNITSNTNGDFSKIRVWNTNLKEEQIVDLYSKDISLDNPLSSNLLINLDLNDDEAGAFYLQNHGVIKSNANIIGRAELYDTRTGPNLTTQTNFIPNIVLHTGDFQYSKKEEAIKRLRKQAPATIVYFNGDGNYPKVERIDHKYGKQIYIYDSNLEKIDSVETEGSFEEYVVDDKLFEYETKHYPKKVEYEIGRFITPYGINLSLGENGFEWEYDVTDYMNDLRGEIELEAHNNQELIDLKFLFIKGEPLRDILRISEPWGPCKSYSYNRLAKDEDVGDAVVSLLPETETIKLKVRLTGHGMVPNTSHPSQCCEFLDNTHYIYAGPTPDDFDLAGEWKIWRHCTDNPVWPQGGTWMLNREGWCPGDIVNDYEVDLTQYISDDRKIALNYEISSDSLGKYPEIGTGSYVATFHLVEYGKAKYKNDLELYKIITPSTEDIYSKLNPICNGVNFIVRNNSDEAIENFEVVLKNGVEEETHFVEKSIAPRSLDTITIMLNDAKFWTGNNNENEIVITLNNQGDENLSNNQGKAIFKIPDIYNKSDFQIKYTSNLRASDYSLKIYDFRNELVKTLPANTNNKIYTFNLTDLPNGCYRLEVTDERYYYGLSSWMVTQQGNGAISIVDSEGQKLKTFNPDFGKRLVYSFVLDGFTSIAQKDINNSIMIYPNPSEDIISFESIEDFGLVSIKIYDLNGNIVLKQDKLLSNNTVTVDVSNLNTGTYSVCISNNDKDKWFKFVKSN
ncbi:MAG: T9SS type A sorting domain-containing protein [Bacteroidetes bacterium]|nr:T9SS type A sorting domain-containing protein [Bacteroidota bacterium]